MKAIVSLRAPTRFAREVIMPAVPPARQDHPTLHKPHTTRPLIRDPDASVSPNTGLS